MAATLALVAFALGWVALAFFTTAVGLLVYARVQSRASFVVDMMLRTSVPLAVTQLILVAVNAAALASGTAWWWLAAQSLLVAVGVYMVIPAAFLARAARGTEGFVIISRGLLEGLHARLDEMYGPGPARIITYSVGKQAGEADARSALQAKILTPRLLWRWLPYIFRLTGYGQLRIERFEDGREAVLHVKHSFEVFTHHMHGEMKNGCDLTRGYLAGIGRAAHPELECQTEETRCGQLHGGDTCTFVIRWFEKVKPEAKVEVVA